MPPWRPEELAAARGALSFWGARGRLEDWRQYLSRRTILLALTELRLLLPLSSPFHRAPVL